jgi:hypothetical protein
MVDHTQCVKMTAKHTRSIDLIKGYLAVPHLIGTDDIFASAEAHFHDREKPREIVYHKEYIISDQKWRGVISPYTEKIKLNQARVWSPQMFQWLLLVVRYKLAHLISYFSRSKIINASAH